jgi:hypothetical protein
MNRTEPHRRRLFLKTLLAAAAPVPGKAFSGAGRMEREILDAIHSLILLKEEKDIELFLRHRRQRVDKIEEDHPRYEITFKDRWQPFSEFIYLLRKNERLFFTTLEFKEIEFGEIRKEFSQIYFGFIESIPYMRFIKRLPQGTLCFWVKTLDRLTMDDYKDVQNGILLEKRLWHLPVSNVEMNYGQIFKGYQLEDDPSYEQG